MNHDVPDRILRLAAQTPVHGRLSRADLRRRFGDVADYHLRRGQLWRARWDDVSVLVLVLAVEDRRVRVSPVTIDPPGEDEGCLVLEAESTSLGVPTTIWVPLTRFIPLRVFEQPLDEWDRAVVDWCEAASTQRLARFPTGARAGHCITSVFEAAAEVRAEIIDDLEVLDEAPAVPTVSADQVPADLRKVLKGLNLTGLRDALGISQPEAMRILRGKQPLAPEQIDVLAQLAEVNRDAIAATVRPLPLELAAELEHPRWRATWAELARRSGISEAAARLEAGYGTYALAARQTGATTPSWRDRLRRWVEAEDASDGAR